MTSKPEKEFFIAKPKPRISPPVLTRIQELPFNELSWENFEDLCLRLAQTESENVESRKYGKQGDSQAGIDIYAKLAHGSKYIIYQCKRVKSFGPTPIESAVSEFLRGDWVDKTDTFILCTSTSLRSKRKLDAVEKQRRILKAKEINFRIWDSEELSILLKDKPEIVDDFFGKQWVEAFCGAYAAVSLTSKSTLDELDKIEKLKYKPLAGYLSQDVVPIYEEQSEDIDIIRYQQKLSIHDLIKKERNIVLLGDSGIGKTTTLIQIASKHSNNDSPLYPFVIELNKYTNKDLFELLPEKYEKVPSNRLLLLLDGFDEIESKNKLSAIRNIESFSQKFPEMKIIITCRSNFYRAPSDYSAGTLDGFMPYQILPLDDEQVEGFINKKLGVDSAKFIDQIRNSNIFGLFRIPFYLVETMKHPQIGDLKFYDKASLLETIFSSIMLTDINHFRTTIDLKDHEKEIIGLLKYLALGMESLGRNYVTKKEYEALITDKDNRILLKHSSAWKYISGEFESWSFEHNNLQEYLAAKVLSELASDDIKIFVSFGPDYKKINPTWVNTLSFLFSILPKQSELLSEILEWLKDIEPEQFVKFERDKVDLRWRIERFKEIFNSYREKKIWINRDKYNYRELAKFGESEEVFNFLLAEIENNTHRIIQSNAIELLMYMDLPETFKKRSRDTLTKVILSANSKNDTKFIALMAIAELQVSDQESLDKIIRTLKSSTNDYVRAGLYYLLKETDNVDKHFDVLIDGFDLISSNFMLPDKKSRLLDEIIQLKAAISEIKNPNSFEQIVKYFIDKPNQINDIFDEKVFDKFIQKAIEVSTESKSVTDSILLLLGILVDEHITTMVEQTLKFFDDTNSRLSSFKNIYLERKNIENSDLLLGALADSEALLYLINEYNENSFNDDEITRFRLGLSWFNHEKGEEFEKLISRELEGRYTLQVQRDYNKEREDGLKFDIDLLFNKEEFIKQLNFVFKNENKKSFESNELFRLGSRADEDLIYPDVVLMLLRHYAGEAEISHKYAIEIVNGLNWEDFAIGRLYNFHKHHNELQLLPEQVEYIKTWCFSKLEITDFTKAMTVNKNGSTRIDSTANLLWFFMHKYEFEYPEDKLLEMLSFDSVSQFGFKGIGYIEKRVSESKVKSNILKNIEKGIQAYPVMKSHLNYCKRKRLKDSVQYALDVIKDKKWYEDIRSLALDTIIEIENSLQKVESVLKDITDDFKWVVVKSLIENGSTEIENYLLKAIKEGNEGDKYKSSIHLMKLNKIDGLRYFVSWTKKNMQYHEDDFLGSPIAKICSDEAIPLLIELLKIGHMKELKDDDFYPLRAAVMNTLTNIALESEENFGRVKNELTTFIESNLKKYPNSKFLNLDIERLEKRYYVNKSEKITIDEVIVRLSNIF